jgi:hypothetical protein
LDTIAYNRLRFCRLEMAEHLNEPAAAPPAAVRRPLAVTLVGLLAFPVGIYNVVDGVLVLAGGGTRDRLAAGALTLALGVLAILIGLGALGMRRWAWAALMTWAVIGLTHQILRDLFFNDTSYVAMALYVIAVLALSPRDTQIAFGVRPPRNVELRAHTRNPIDRD